MIMWYTRAILAIIIFIYILYQYDVWRIDKSILWVLVWWLLLFEHHINRLIDILNK